MLGSFVRIYFIYELCRDKCYLVVFNPCHRSLKIVDSRVFIFVDIQCIIYSSRRIQVREVVKRLLIRVVLFLLTPVVAIGGFLCEARILLIDCKLLG